MTGARETIAFLGTGRMGTPIAHNLLDAGYPVTVWNRTPARAAALVDAGAPQAATPAEAAAQVEVLVTMLTDGPAVEAVMTGADGALSSLRPGAIWIQMGTIGLESTERLAGIAGERGVEFVDAPVSGSDGPAHDGELVILASGPQELRALLAPIFATIGKETLWLGPAGQGTRLKLVLNNYLAAQVEAVAETIALAEALGVRPHLFTDTIAESALGSPYAVLKGKAMIAGEFEPGFALRHAFKDVGLALDAARDRRVELPVTEALAGPWREAIAHGHGDDDVSAVIAVASRAVGNGLVTASSDRA